MKHFFTLCLMLSLASATRAQSAPGWPQDYLPSPSEVNGAFAAKQDLTVKIPGVPGGASPPALASVMTRLGLVPDDFKLAGDGIDDAPSIQRAINQLCSGAYIGGMGGDLEIQGRHYGIHSAITQNNCTVHWKGRVAQEFNAATSGQGSWLDIGTEFANSGTAPITFTGFNSTGSIVERIGVVEPGQTPAPVAVGGSASFTGAISGTTLTVTGTVIGTIAPGLILSGTGVAAGTAIASGSGTTWTVNMPQTVPAEIMTGAGTIGWSPSTWAPVVYPPVFDAEGMIGGGVKFRDISFVGVHRGIKAVNSQRTDFRDIRGQVFDYLIYGDQLYDTSRIIDIHVWPFWSLADPVIQYQQANADIIRSYRSDTPFMDRIFGLGMRAGLALLYSSGGGTSGTPGGATTGAAIGTLSCDFIQYCVLIGPNANVQAHINSIRTFGQAWSTIVGPPASTLTSSNMIEVSGTATLQIGQAQDYGSQNVVSFDSPPTSSNISIGSLLVYLQNMAPGAKIAQFPTSTGTVPSNLYVSIPILTGTPPSGYTVTNTAPNGSGIGSMQVGTLATVH